MHDHATDPNAAPAPLRSEFADDEEMRELVEFFVGELGTRVGSIEQAFSSGDADQLRTLAHQLKGAAGGYGFPSISEQAACLESAVKDAGAEALDGVKREVDALCTLCRRASA